MATEQFCNFHMHDWLRKRVENDCVELPRVCLLRVLVMQFQNFMTNPEEVGQAISELSRELSTNQIALFSHRVLK